MKHLQQNTRHSGEPGFASGAPHWSGVLGELWVYAPAYVSELQQQLPEILNRSHSADEYIAHLFPAGLSATERE